MSFAACEGPLPLTTEYWLGVGLGPYRAWPESRPMLIRLHRGFVGSQQCGVCPADSLRKTDDPGSYEPLLSVVHRRMTGDSEVRIALWVAATPKTLWSTHVGPRIRPR